MSDSLHPVSAQELELFSERIGRSLAERPLEINVAEHRERVAALIREVGAASFYQLLAVGPAASSEKIHEGYERVARLVHPSHAPYLGLAGREGVLEVLFERATAAYIVLSHPGRRRDYDREIGPSGWLEPAAASNRAEENRDRARTCYNRATAYLAKEDFHFATELLREAVRIDPQAKYYVLLAELQTKNEHWLRQAADSYGRALELGGPDPQIEEALHGVRRRMEEIAGGSPLRPPERTASGSGSRPVVHATPALSAPFHQPIRYEIESDGTPAMPDDAPPPEDG
jgi:tetratricopeptide (TPR) repeat protein